MTHFESVGVDYQYAASDTYKAKRAFEYSCDRCGKQGKQIDCDRCAIAFTHSLIMTYLKNKAN